MKVLWEEMYRPELQEARLAMLECPTGRQDAATASDIKAKQQMLWMSVLKACLQKLA